MIIVTTENVHGRTVHESLGRHVGKDVQSVMLNFVGGEITHYTKLLGEAREQALDRMMDQARSMGADAVISVRFSTSEIATGAAEIVAYGTAVKLAL